MPSKEELAILQALPLELKIRRTQQRIREFYDHFGGEVYVSLSGGKDSTVLLHLVREIYPDVPAVFMDTGLEYPEIKSFVRGIENVEVLRPKITFVDAITNYGYPLVSKEVAEAIYYARRVLPEDKPNNTGILKREELQGLRISSEIITKQSELVGQYIGDRKSNSETYLRRRELCGDRDDTERGHGATERYMRVRLMGKYENGAHTDEIYEDAVLTGQTPSSNGSSMFNKVKWLPLARESPFRIAAYCCGVMKKSPAKKYQSRTHRKPFIGTMAEESRMRKQAWLKNGCNAFDSRKPTSQPLSFWTEQDVLEYIRTRGIQIASVYGDIIYTDKENQVAMTDVGGAKLTTTGAIRTGCIFCGFGMHLEKTDRRFERLHKTHPKLYDYAIGGGLWIDNPDYIEGLDMEPDCIGWVNWNPERIWVPSKSGLGMGYVFDYCNELYGKKLWIY